MKTDLITRLQKVLSHFEGSGRWNPSPDPATLPQGSNPLEYRYETTTFYCEDKNETMDAIKEAIAELSTPTQPTN